MSTLWTDEELKAAVQSYQKMMKYEKERTPFVKAEINRELQTKIERSKSSIEKRFQNISAILDAKGLPWVKGYVPLSNVGTNIKDKLEALLWLK